MVDNENASSFNISERTYRCDERNEGLIIKNYPRHILTTKFSKNTRISHRSKIIDEAKKEGVEVTYDDI